MFSQSYVPLGYQQVTSIGSAAILAVPAGANFAIISAESAGVRWTDDGSVPTATVGMPMADTDAPLQYSGTLTALQFIAQTGSPKLNVSYYRSVG